MSKLKIDEFVDLVKKSGLVDNERLNQALSGVDQSVKDSGLVASILTKADLLTEWQSEKLLQGRHKGFYLGKYKLLRHLGTGGMGAVYLAEHRLMKHRVAIKVLASSLAARKSYVERFHQEARASAQLDHPNMVKAVDVDYEGNTHYLVMQYVDGCDLQAIVSRQGPLDYRMAADYTRQAALGLAYAHRTGLIHRDIKPANLLIDKDGVVKILDMGLARFTDETQGSLTRDYDQKMIGTVDYQPPEQACDSHKVDARADIYSLGCTLYFMLSGDAPFPTGTIPQRVMQHQTAEPRDVREMRPDAPAGLLAICRKMMAKSPADRYQTADEVAEALAAWLDGRDPVGISMYRQAAAPSGPSLNENLTLAPLDDEPPKRTVHVPIPEAKSGDASASGVSSSKRGETATPKKAAGSGVKGDAAERTKEKKPHSGKSDAPRSKEDLLEDLITMPKLPAAAPLEPTPTLVSVRKRQREKEEEGMPGWIIAAAVAAGVGLLGALAALAYFVL